MIETADAPPCPPWCPQDHEVVVGGWDADSTQAGYFYKRCQYTLPAPAGLDSRVCFKVGVDRWSHLDLGEMGQGGPAREVQPATVYLCDEELTPDQADALAAKLREAAQLARA